MSATKPKVLDWVKDLPHLSDVDKAEIRAAIALIKGVAYRHPLELTGPLLVTVQAAVHDMETIAKQLEAVAS